uniref:Uncharacterized protein n=1 Tax=Chromera velia CCMP2878 TaxID=1169474 RepID=A0A0G4GNN9_9ALVE|eukprot:Cvel_22654.t1-p1 / transcript=Cvel_22654.t1 / gene=Cvel_22654 / organism=Chromera_velia_CCMP2878 / gene_product=hypothetical protein / transcript_product=hypothetical protein / location=Cvel_scaffold2250:13370-18594(-) / protein_length=324 / sequence_SO=supercontig / SO=protein_coding / is_pseudo=false
MDCGRCKSACKKGWTTGKQVQTMEWSWQMRLAYYGLIGLIVLGIAGLQVWLTYLSEDTLIAIQIGDTCSAVFDGIDRGWVEARIFTLALSANFYSTDFSISQDQHRKFADTEVYKSMEYLQNVVFVRHLPTYQDGLTWEAQMKTEFSSGPSASLVETTVFNNPDLSGYYPNGIDSFYMFGYNFDRGVYPKENFEGTESYDPIIYQTSWDPNIWGFFPDPEPPRIRALATARDTDDLACSGRINLFGKNEQPAETTVPKSASSSTTAMITIALDTRLATVNSPMTISPSCGYTAIAGAVAGAGRERKADSLPDPREGVLIRKRGP